MFKKLNSGRREKSQVQRFTLFIHFPPNISMIKTKEGEDGEVGRWAGGLQ